MGEILFARVAAFAGVVLALALSAPVAAWAAQLLEKRESLYNNIFIFSDGDTVSMTFGANKRYFTESAMKLSDPGALIVDYTRYMTMGVAYPPKVEKIAEIGLGGGRTVSYLNQSLPDTGILAIELDKDVIELAKKYFKFQESATSDGGFDGRAFLLKDTDKWDVILIDAYRGPFVPFHLLTKEFYELVKSRLNPGGVVVQNIEPTTMLFDSASATLKSVFPSVDLYDGGGNVVAVGHDGPQILQSDLLARAAKMQQHYKLRYDLTKLAADRRILTKPEGKILTDDFAPVETMRAIAKNNEKWKEQTEAPADAALLARGIVLLGLALVLGFALMGFEMLGSRYLYPYFGGGINTWASLIATVLVALMAGYLLGGALVDRTLSAVLCGVLLIAAGVYLFTIPLWVDPLFTWMLTSVGDGMAAIILAAAILLLLPLTLISTFTPFAVRLLLTSVTMGGRIVSYVYGVSTIGNVLGTLVTTFVLVPSFGSRALTMMFAGLTIVCGAVMMLAGRAWRGVDR